ncbi:MAG: TIGR02302 family protein [Methylovirgula sp.]
MTNNKGLSGPAPAPRRLEKLVGMARATLFWEKLWRAVVPQVLVVGLFVSISFAGVWVDVGRLGRILGVGLFGVALAISVLPLFGLRLPSRRQALARIDRSSDRKHNPASGIDDKLANEEGDPTTRALWTAHRRRLLQEVAGLKVGAPSPRMVDFDRYAVRAAVLVLLVATAFLAGPEKYARVAAAFDWRGATPLGANYRIDAWIDPPAYTGKPPVMLKLAADQAQQIEAPIHSIVIVRASGGDVGVETEGGLEPVTKSDAGKSASGDSERRLALGGDAKLSLRHAGALVGSFSFVAIPDLPPQIELTDAPRSNVRGSLTLSYAINDDYGVTSAAADFADPTVEGATGHLRSLVPPPHLSLPLPPGPGGLGETEATVDLSAHAWAGAHVKMTLTAHDGGGNVGRSEPIEITLPQRPFVKPLARALIEQRRNLVLFPDQRDHVQTALEALMIAPDAFGESSSIFLGLSVASHMLHDAQNDDDLLKVADYLWSMALQIENGSLSEAERDLRAAEQQLRDALQRNASEEEIRKLTENLRAAMDKFLNEFANQQARELGNQQQRPPENSPSQDRSVSRQDLQSMLDRMQQMARSGDRADAQRMLEQLQNTLENLQMAHRRDADPTTRAMNNALRELDRLTREQQALRDETNRQAQAEAQAREKQEESDDQQQNQAGQQGQPNDQAQNQQGQQSASRQDLHDRQQELRNRLEEVERQLKQMGQDQSGLSEAQKAMKDAENALNQDKNQGQNQGQNQGPNQGQNQGQNPGGQGQGQSPGGQSPGTSQDGGSQAVEAQGRALQALRKGADQLAQATQRGGEGQGAGGDQQGDQEGAGQAEGGGDTDPLGRPLANDPAFDPHARFDPMGIPAAERAQRVLEELRRRLSDPLRSQEELDYLQRLLNLY